MAPSFSLVLVSNTHLISAIKSALQTIVYLTTNRTCAPWQRPHILYYAQNKTDTEDDPKLTFQDYCSSCKTCFRGGTRWEKHRLYTLQHIDHNRACTLESLGTIHTMTGRALAVRSLAVLPGVVCTPSCMCYGCSSSQRLCPRTLTPRFQIRLQQAKADPSTNNPISGSLFFTWADAVSVLKHSWRPRLLSSLDHFLHWSLSFRDTGGSRAKPAPPAACGHSMVVLYLHSNMSN